MVCQTSAKSQQQNTHTKQASNQQHNPVNRLHGTSTLMYVNCGINDEHANKMGGRERVDEYVMYGLLP